MKKTDKKVDIYERLANALEALPGGFARTESGVEMELIKMAFSPEEASLAGQMSRTPETATEIAKRVDLPVDEVTVLLKKMIPRRMVRVADQGRGGVPHGGLEGEMRYRLGHFLVGWYEGNERALGREYAVLFERYVVEGGGDRIFSPRPGSQGVVPFRGSLKPEWLAREPHLDIDAHWERHERFLVVNCMCRAEGAGARKPLRCPRQALRVYRPAADDPAGGHVLTRDEAKKLFIEIES